VLQGVTLSVEPGHSVAIVGPSGSGKSTILRLLVRLYDVKSGKVLLDSIDVKDLTQASLRGAVAVVPQDTVLFNDTILSNIAYGRPTASREEVIKAAEMARLSEAIMRMPAGYDTMVGERGLKLSGGEKQRVAIARAFLRAPRLLICDEATSALDTATEQGIMTSLNELAAGRTSVFVAHRLSTIQRCDKIIVMSNGVVVEQGTHDDLMAARRVYYDMWEAQAAAQEELEKVTVASLASIDVPADAHTHLHCGSGSHGHQVGERQSLGAGVNQ
jgi:ABC transporter ATM